MGQKDRQWSKEEEEEEEEEEEDKTLIYFYSNKTIIMYNTLQIVKTIPCRIVN